MRSLPPVLLMAALAASPVRAQTIDDARRSYLEADFRVAVDQFEAVLGTPSVDRAGAGEAHRHLAALRLLLGDEETARRHADAAVALDPAVASPAGAPPALEAILADARERFAGRAASIAIARTAEADDWVVRAAVDPAPEALAERIGLRCVHGPEAVEESAAPPAVTVRLTRPSETVHCRAWISGRGGAHLIEASRRLVPDAAEVAPATDVFAPGEAEPPEDPEEDDGAGLAWPWIGVAAGVALAGAVIVVLLLATSDTDGARIGAPQAEGW